MKTVGHTLDPFRVTGVKPGFNHHEEEGVSAFEELTEKSFPGKWKVIYFYPKDFTFVCPTEIVGFAKLAADFEDRDAVLLAGSTDNEFVKLAWRRDHKDLDRLNHWMFADTTGALVDMLENLLYDQRAGGLAPSVVGDRLLYTLNDAGHTAVREALDYVHRAILAAPGLGAGHGPLNHFVDARPRY